MDQRLPRCSEFVQIMALAPEPLGRSPHTTTVDCTLLTAFFNILKKLSFTWSAGYIYDLF